MGGKARGNKLMRTFRAFNISDNIVNEILSYKISQEFPTKSYSCFNLN